MSVGKRWILAPGLKPGGTDFAELTGQVAFPRTSKDTKSDLFW